MDWQFRGSTFEQHLHCPQLLNVPKMAGSDGRHVAVGAGAGSHTGTKSPAAAATLPPA
jgi:hypothetical protein